MNLTIPVAESVVHKVANEIECLYTAADCLIGFEQLNKRYETQQAPDFWQHVHSALMGAFVINFCKLFGVDCNDRFWKQLTIEQKEFRERIYSATGFDYNHWMDYRKSMTELRNRISVHLTPYSKIRDIPDFEPARQMLQICHHWFAELYQQLGMALSGPMAEPEYFARITRETADILSA